MTKDKEHAVSTKPKDHHSQIVYEQLEHFAWQQTGLKEIQALFEYSFA